MSEAFWDAYAPREARRAEDNPEDFIYGRQVAAFLRSLASADDEVLDVGGGPGRFSLDLARLVRRVEHVDLSAAMLALAADAARRLGIDNIAFRQADARSLPYPDRHFTRVLSINTPVSFCAEDWRTAVAEMCRVAEREVLFTVSNYISCLPVVLDACLAAGAGWNDLAETMCQRRLMDGARAREIGVEFPSYRAFTPDEIEAELDRQGFAVATARGLAILCRLMKPESLKALVADERLLGRFLDCEEALAATYGRWAPSRELLFVARRQ